MIGILATIIITMLMGATTTQVIKPKYMYWSAGAVNIVGGVLFTIQNHLSGTFYSLSNSSPYNPLSTWGAGLIMLWGLLYILTASLKNSLRGRFSVVFFLEKTAYVYAWVLGIPVVLSLPFSIYSLLNGHLVLLGYGLVDAYYAGVFLKEACRLQKS